MLNCRKVTELVTDYLEGRMSRLMRLRFRFHLGWCRHCRLYVEQMKATIQALRCLPKVPPSDRVRDDLLKSFREMRSGSP